MNKLCSLALLTLVSAAAAQELSVHPASPAPGEPLFVRVAGTFPTPCSLAGNELDLLHDGDTVVVTLTLEQDPCPQVITDLVRSFGAFRLDPALVSPGMTIELVFRTDENEVARVDLTIGSAGEGAAVVPQSGIYWDPVFANNGVAIEAHGHDLFVAAYTYDGSGEATWRVAQGELNGRHFEADFLAFRGGACLLCRRPGSQGQVTGPSSPMQLVFEGGQAAFLGVGIEPGPALELRPFALRLVESEPTIAAETFFMADLGGRWLFTDTVDGTLHLITELAQTLSGGADTGLAFFASPDRSVTLECGRGPAPERFICRLFVDGDLVGEARSSEVGPNAIRGDAFVGVRLQ